MTDSQTNAQLLASAQCGDAHALQQLLRRVQPTVYRYSVSMCRHQQDAEDVLQETMIALARSLTGIRGDSSLSTWLYSVARNACIKKRRKRTFPPDVEELLDASSSLPADNTRPDKIVEQGQLWQQLQIAITGLHEDLKDVLVLRDIEGISTRETATVLNLSEAAVKSRLHRARKELQNALAPSELSTQCPNLSESLSQYLNGEVSPEICCKIESHLGSCKACDTDLRALQDTLRLCKRAPTGQVPGPVADRVKSALLSVISSSNS